MAEFKEVIKQFNRMCEAQEKICDKCPVNKKRGLFNCWRALAFNPDEMEESVMQWAKEHPPITNNDKIKEIFGLDFKSTFTASPWTLEWLDEEYKEPKDE